MPIDFERCRANGGKIRTKVLSDGKYMHVCIPRGGGPSVGGEVKQRQSAGFLKGKTK